MIRKFDFFLFSGLVDHAAMRAELEALPGLLAAHGHAEVACAWQGCPSPALQPSILPAARLPDVVRRLEAAGTFTLGEMNLVVTARDGSFEYTFCHDEDLHFHSRDRSLFDAMKERWTAHGFRGRFSVVPKRWERFGPA